MFKQGQKGFLRYPEGERWSLHNEVTRKEEL